MSDEDQEKRKQALETLKHPLNRQFLELVIDHLEDDGVYFWPDMMMEFTKAELEQALADAKKKES